MNLKRKKKKKKKKKKGKTSAVAKLTNKYNFEEYTACYIV
jgi:hypothetical protein